MKKLTIVVAVLVLVVAFALPVVKKARAEICTVIIQPGCTSDQ